MRPSSISHERHSLTLRSEPGASWGPSSQKSECRVVEGESPDTARAKISVPLGRAPLGPDMIGHLSFDSALLA